MKTNLLGVKDVVEEGGVSPAGGEQIDPVLFLRGVDGAPGFFLLDFDAGDVGKDSDVPLTEVRALALQHAHATKSRSMSLCLGSAKDKNLAFLREMGSFCNILVFIPYDKVKYMYYDEFRFLQFVSFRCMVEFQKSSQYKSKLDL